MTDTTKTPATQPSAVATRAAEKIGDECVQSGHEAIEAEFDYDGAAQIIDEETAPLLKALDDIAKGMISGERAAEMNAALEAGDKLAFRSALFTWSQEHARAVLAKATP